MKKSALILLVAFATLSFTSSEDITPIEEYTGCSQAFSDCNKAYPENYDLFAKCMDEKGCGGPVTGED